jgi:signal recognition particle subunit SRP54
MRVAARRCRCATSPAPIKFVGAGEKPDALDRFHPDRAASRILDMGDVLSLVEEVERKVDQDKAQKLAEKVIKGKKFDLNDMRDQLLQMQNMGGLPALMDKLPGMGQIPRTVKQQGQRQGSAAHDRDHQFDDQEGTPHPDLLNGSRRPAWRGARARPGRRQQACSSSTSRWKR